MKRALTAIWVTVLASGALAINGCSSSHETTGEPAPSENTGVIGLDLTVAGGITFDSQSFAIVGPNGFSKSGSIELSAATKLSATIGGIPAGNGYTITLSGTSTDGSTSCTGSATFNVTAHATSQVSVALVCHQAPTTGSLLVNGSLNVCPVVDELSANPGSVYLGASLALSGAAHDSDAAPSPLDLRWNASSGLLSNGNGSHPTFTCTAPGPVTITLSANDGDAACADTQSVVVNCSLDASATFYTTKTPYHPRQTIDSYEAPPPGFSMVYTELVARHGSRGLSSVKYDAAALNMWKKASDDGALTALGQSLGADITKLMKANALLGFGIAGIGTPGYGNLTKVGIGEQQQLANRLLQRLPSYFAGVAASASSAAPRALVFVSSGVDRAVDSAGFFTQAIANANPVLGSLLTPTAALTAYPANAPAAQPAGFNHFLLYFHKLAAKTDLVSNSADPYYQTYQNSLAFQAYASDPDLTAKVSSALGNPAATSAARTVLEGLFSKAFVDKIENKTYSFANTGSYSFTSDDGVYSATVTGDGKTTVKSLADAASMLYNLYVIAPAMKNEVDVDFTRYIPADQARSLAYQQDVQDFYQMGPGIQEANPITYQMAQALEDDFFTEVDAVVHGDLSHGAKLRFTHAEIIVPFASLLGLKGVFSPVPKADTYTYETNPWRGELVSPMAANIQWDVVRNAAGAVLVKMLYNERETDFKAACDGARHEAGSHFYDFDKLAACYGHTH
ncbi:MAG: histidine-type phosphatase [Pseudomonadota bacterium]